MVSASLLLQEGAVDIFDFCGAAMENFHSNIGPLYPKATDMNSHIQAKNTHMGSPFAMRSRGYYHLHQLTSPPLDSYKLENWKNIDPQILKSLTLSSSSSSSGDNFSTPSAQNRTRYRGGYGSSPLSLVESFRNSTSSSAAKSPCVFANTPFTTEEDVLVMDGVLVVNALGGRSRSGNDSYGSSSSSVKGCKMDVCPMWAGTGSCPFGSSCQDSHRKEELIVTRFSSQGKREVEICFPRSPFNNSSLSRSLRGQNSSPSMSRAYERSPQGAATVGNNGCRDSCGSSGTSRADWVPQDDGIDVSWHNPSRDKVSEYINSYLYSPPVVKSRLPVFTSICPDVPGSSSISDK